MQKKSKNTPIYIFAFCLFAASIAWLAYKGISEEAEYFLTVSEAKAAPQTRLQSVRLFGLVAKDELMYDAKKSQAEFFLIDPDQVENRLRVSYSGPIPDTFKEGSEVIVAGDLASDNFFQAKSLMTKCPSKYQAQNRKQQ